jgi:hypothetical protein
MHPVHHTHFVLIIIVIGIAALLGIGEVFRQALSDNHKVKEGRAVAEAASKYLR